MHICIWSSGEIAEYHQHVYVVKTVELNFHSVKRELKTKFRVKSVGKVRVRKGSLRRRWGGNTFQERVAAQVKEEGEVEGCRDGL